MTYQGIGNEVLAWPPVDFYGEGSLGLWLRVPEVSNARWQSRSSTYLRTHHSRAVAREVKQGSKFIGRERLYKLEPNLHWEMGRPKRTKTLSVSRMPHVRDKVVLRCEALLFVLEYLFYPSYIQ